MPWLTSQALTLLTRLRMLARRVLPNGQRVCCFHPRAHYVDMLHWVMRVCAYDSLSREMLSARAGREYAERRRACWANSERQKRGGQGNEPLMCFCPEAVAQVVASSDVAPRIFIDGCVGGVHAYVAVSTILLPRPIGVVPMQLWRPVVSPRCRL